MSAGIYTIPAGTPFVDALAAGLLARYGDAGDLSGVSVLLPTRRACRALREAFLRVGGGRALLLPVLRPIGEVEEDALGVAAVGARWEGGAEQILDLPPAIPPLRRRLLLAQLILRLDQQRPGGRESDAMVPDQALFLAAELARLLDLMQTEGVGFEALDDIVPENLAAHWQQTLEFLRLLTQHWPKVPAAEGALDPADRRNRLMVAQAAQWRDAPPADPIIAAGSTGTVPATAELMGVIAGLPAGAVVLPGLDLAMASEAWQAIDPTHPQAAMKQLIERLGAERGDVAIWESPVAPPAAGDRTALIAAALRPATAWDAPDAKEGIDTPVKSTELRTVTGLHVMECAGPEEEARAVALVLREALEDPGRTAALITPDRQLARRVAVELTRWRISIDDSAGVPLANTAIGSFLRLTAVMAAERFAPVPLLAALKHPFASGGTAASAFRTQVRRLERRVLRGPRPAPGLAGLAAAIDAWAQRHPDNEAIGRTAAALRAWLQTIADAAQALDREIAAPSADLGVLVRAHLQLAEALAADDGQTGDRRLWAGDAGEAAAQWIAEVLAAAPSAPQILRHHYPLVLDALMTGVAVRPSYGHHPRLHIWGTLEARLQHADTLVLGGLNEGTWPGEPAADPWLSRPMRAEAGLPSPEQRIGLSAHDFAQAAAAPAVVLTRATKVVGQPTVPSRWLVRLQATLQGVGRTFAPSPWLAWQEALDRPAKVRPVAEPAPTPPVSARPRELSATRIETWVRDPFAIYAEKVLGLKALDPIDADPGAPERGTIIHRALDAFVQAYPVNLPDDALPKLLDHGRAAFGADLDRPGVWAFWWPRFEQIARWFIAHERDRRRVAAVAGSEIRGALEIAGPGGPFALTAKADRIETIDGDDEAGGLVIVDYKSGTAPSLGDIRTGFSPQLPVEAVIAEGGGFEGIAPRTVREIAVWQVNGKGEGGTVKPYKKLDLPATIESTRAGLSQFVAGFDRQAMPYRSRPRPEHGPRFSDYDHLARIREWSAGPEDEEA